MSGEGGRRGERALGRWPRTGRGGKVFGSGLSFWSCRAARGDGAGDAPEPHGLQKQPA